MAFWRSLLKDARLWQLACEAMNHIAMGRRWGCREISKRRVVLAPRSRNHYRCPKIIIWLVRQNPKIPGLTNLKAKDLARQRLYIIHFMYKPLLRCPAIKPKCLERTSWWSSLASKSRHSLALYSANLKALGEVFDGSERWVRKHSVWFLARETSLATLNTILTPVEQNFGETLTKDHVTLHHSCTAEGCKRGKYVQ